MRINGADFVNGAINFTTSAASGGRLGQYTNGTDPMVDGAIAAMVFAGDVQTLTDIQKLEGYLAQRFVGTTFLPVGHPYRSTAPR